MNLTKSPFLAGQFVWCAYPESERPLSPGPRHIGYIIAIGESRTVFRAMVAYTTSRPWTGANPLGLYTFSRDQAVMAGQDKPFVLDLRRIAYIPIEVRWFPDLAKPEHGRVGAAAEVLRLDIEATLKTLLQRHSRNIERLGPLWP